MLKLTFQIEMKGCRKHNHFMNGIMLNSPSKKQRMCETCCIPMQMVLLNLLFHDKNESVYKQQSAGKQLLAKHG